MPNVFANGDIKRIFAGGDQIHKVYACSTPTNVSLVYSSAQKVTYVVDTVDGVEVKKEYDVEYGVNCLDHKKIDPNFTPTKTNCTFVGWCTSKDASGSVLSNCVMGTAPITLYALFTKTVNAHFVRYYNNKNKDTKTVPKQFYYNNGVMNAPTFNTPATVADGGGTNYNNWVWRGWSAANVTAGNAPATYTNGASVGKLYNDTYFYGLYKYEKTTVNFTDNGSTGGSAPTALNPVTYWSTSGTNGTYVYPEITLPPCSFTKSCYAFSKWALGSASGTQTAAGGKYKLTSTSNITFYATWTAVNNSQMWSGTIEPHGTSENVDSSGAYYIGEYDLTGFKKLRLKWYVNKNIPGSESNVNIYVGTSSNYKDNARILEWEIDYVGENGWEDTKDVSINFTGKQKVFFTRGGHDNDTTMTGTITLLTA